MRVWLSEKDYFSFNGAISDLAGKDLGGADSDRDLYQMKMAEMDFTWAEVMRDNGYWIAHALGGEDDAQNTKSAYANAEAAGFKFFEVDIVYQDGLLRCAHDIRNIGQSGQCDFDWLIQTAETDQVWFILDVKSDFKDSYSQINTELNNRPIGKHFIPQIYTFNQASYLDLSTLAGPLFTGYRRNQGAGFLHRMAAELNLPIITLPPNSVMTINADNPVKVLTHGVAAPGQIKKLSAQGVSGFYIKTRVYKQLGLATDPK